LGLDRTPAMAEYIQQMLTKPGMQAWAEQALAEPWIEPGHEADCLQVGDIVEDLRSIETQ